MIEVGVDEEQFAAAFIAQHGPCRQSFAGPVPPLRTGRLGLLAQPEHPGVEQFETVAAEKHGVELARPRPVLPADADRPVTGQQGLQVVELVGKHLLRPQQIDSLRADQPGDPFAAETPVVHPVFGIVIAHIERHHGQLLRGVAGNRSRQRQQKKQLLHGRIILRTDFQRESARTPPRRGLSSPIRAPAPRNPRNRAVRRHAVPLRGPRARWP